MTFLQPFILWALPLVLIPVVIHMLNRMRHRPMRWAAMQFLLAATRSSTNQAKIKQWLILFFRVIAVLLLVLFLSRPLSGGWVGWALASAPDTILLLVDRSSSMEMVMAAGGETRRERVLRQLSEAAREYEGASHFFLMENVQRAPQALARASDLRNSPATTATDSSADLPSMLQSALTWLVENRAGTAEIWIGTDLQKSTWKPEDERWKALVSGFGSLAQKVRFRVLGVSGGEVANTSVTVRECIRRRRGDGSELSIALDLVRSSAEQARIPLTVEVDGATTQVEAVSESQSLRYRTTVPLGNKQGGGWGRVRLPADGNAADNAAYFVFGPEKTHRVLVVAADRLSGAYSALGFKALAAGERLDIQSRSSLGAESRLDEVSVICWQGSLPSGAEATRLQSWVEAGGVVVFFPPGQADGRSFLGSGWAAIQAAPSEDGWAFARWAEEDGLLARTDEGISIGLKRTVVRKRQVLAGEKQTLAAFQDGETFLARRVVGKGQLFFCSTLLQPEWSSLGDGIVWVPLCQRLIQAGALRDTQRSMLECGELGVTELRRSWKSVASNGDGGVQASAGVYRDGGTLIAVNRPESEGSVEAVPMDEALRGLSPLPVQGLMDSAKPGREGMQGELWRVLVVLMLVALLVEGILVLPGKTGLSADEVAGSGMAAGGGRRG